MSKLVSKLEMLNITYFFTPNSNSGLTFLECFTPFPLSTSVDKKKLDRVVRFQIYLGCLSFPIKPIYGVRFRRLEGRPMDYKICRADMLMTGIDNL